MSRLKFDMPKRYLNLGHLQHWRFSGGGNYRFQLGRSVAFCTLAFGLTGATALPAAADYDSFLEWCENRNAISPEAQDTVMTVMARLSVSDCETAHEAASQASDLDLSQTIVTDLRPLATLSALESLSLDDNEDISDLSPLASLHNLNSLSLVNNQVAELSPLSNLSELEYLYASHNQIRDLSPLSGLTQLRYLELSHNQIQDITPLQFYNRLNSLDLSHNQIDDISILSQLESSIFSLALGNNNITDISPLIDLSINVLDISTNPINDYSVLSQLVRSGYPGLTALTLGGEQAADLDRIVENLILNEDWAPELSLEIIDSDLRDASRLLPLARLAPRLDALTVRNSQLQDVAPLASLTELTQLSLPNNPLEDLSPLTELRQLERLDLGYTPITDLSPLAALPQLESLDLGYTAVTTVEPLRELPNLHTVVTYGTPIYEQASCLPPVSATPPTLTPSPSNITPAPSNPTFWETEPPELPSSSRIRPSRTTITAQAKQQPGSPRPLPPPNSPDLSAPVTIPNLSRPCRRPSGSEWRYLLSPENAAPLSP
ncbi:MAG: leucine-rich repeat domain-containing protein [Cyanobacteria bacterium J06632_22]